MFTDNYLKFQKARFAASAYHTTTKLVNADGTTFNSAAGFWGTSDIGFWMRRARCQAIVGQLETSRVYTETNQGLYFGTGTTPATRADYKLENPITSGLSITNPTALAWTDDGNGKYCAIADFIVRNTSGAEIKISEIGVFTPHSSDGNDSPVSNTNVHFTLMERTVLDEPIVIPAGEAKLITYKITFNQSVA